MDDAWLIEMMATDSPRAHLLQGSPKGSISGPRSAHWTLPARPAGGRRQASRHFDSCQPGASVPALQVLRGDLLRDSIGNTPDFVPRPLRILQLAEEQ